MPMYSERHWPSVIKPLGLLEMGFTLKCRIPSRQQIKIVHSTVSSRMTAHKRGDIMHATERPREMGLCTTKSKLGFCTYKLQLACSRRLAETIECIELFADADGRVFVQAYKHLNIIRKRATHVILLLFMVSCDDARCALR